MAEQDDQFPSLGAAAAAPQGKKQKKKAQKVSLDSFLADTTTGGSWADEMEDMPTGPSARESGADLDRRGAPPRDDSRGGGFSSSSRGDFGDRPQYDSRPEVPLPTSPPYTAFVGNLSFDTSEGEIGDFFGPTVDRITSIRVVSGPDGKPKGFAYVEFGSLNDLKKALAMSGTSVAGRTVRVSVAEPPKRGFGDDSRAASADAWRRDGPLPSGGGGMGRSSSRDYGDRDRQSYVDEDPNRWTAARGSKFVPSEPQSRSSFGGPRRDFSNQSEAGERDFGSGFERGSKFTPSTSGTNTPAGLDSRRSSSYMADAPVANLAPSEADTASAWRRAAPLSSQPTSPNPATSGQSSPDGAPAVRKRLALAPRTQSSSNTSATSPPASSASTKPNPFGSAAPVDTAEKERAIEAKLEKLRFEAQEKANAAPVRSSAFSSSTRGQSSSPSAPAEKEEKKEPSKILSKPTREGFSFSQAAGKKEGSENGSEQAKEVVSEENAAEKQE